MSQPRWSEHFFVNEQLSKVTLDNQTLSIYNNCSSQSLKLNFYSSFQCQYDAYQNLTCMHIQAGRKISLSHGNPTVLQQWEELLAEKIHKVDFYSDYQPGEKVGEGLSATVHAAVHKASKKKVAAKVFPRSSIDKAPTQFLSLQNQIKILKQLSSAYFPRFISTYVTEKSYYLVYEWCEGINLKQWVHAGLACEKEVKIIFNQMIKALEDIKRLGIVHRDLKPQNIIYDSKKKAIKIVDLGFATYAVNRDHIYPNCGTPGYAAPQTLDKNQTIISSSADVFSLGVTVYFLLLGKLPYPDQCRNIILANKECRFLFDQALVVRPKTYDLMRRMICNIRHRIALQQIACHPYFSREDLKQSPSFCRNDLLAKVTSVEFDNLDLLNKKIQQKRDQRIRRERFRSIRTQSHLKNGLSRERSYGKVNRRIITQRI